MLREFFDFLRHNKKWWLAPIIVMLLLIGVIVILGGTAAAPFIYPLLVTARHCRILSSVRRPRPTVPSRNGRIAPSITRSSETLDLVAAGMGLVLLSPVLLLGGSGRVAGLARPGAFRAAARRATLRPVQHSQVSHDGRRRRAAAAGRSPAATTPVSRSVGQWLRKTEARRAAAVDQRAAGRYEPGRTAARGAEVRGNVSRRLCDDPGGAAGTDRPASIKYRDEAAVLAASDDPERAYVEQVVARQNRAGQGLCDGHSSFAGDVRLILQTLLRIGH